MAKQRPSLGVSASPISTYVAPVAAASAGLELYDQQTVNLALQFSEAFQNLSLTAANFAGSLKAESNKEELQKGLDLVNSSQKTYQQLVEDGQIRPTENPWLAIGAQQGSGMMEGMKARAHFMETYQKRAAEDPKFYDSLDSFNALASQYAQNVGTSLKNSPYQSRAFFEAFNPFVASMSLKHQENVAKTAENKVLMGVGASVAQLTQDIKSQDPIVRSEAMQAFRNSIDEMGQMGVSRTRVNEAVVENMIALMETTDQVEQVQAVYESLDFGYGLVKNTAHAKALYASRAANIERNRQKLTTERDNSWLDFLESSAPQWANRALKRDDVIAAVRENPVWQSLGVQEQQSKMAHALGRYEQEVKAFDKQAEEATQEVLGGLTGNALKTDLSTVGNIDTWASTQVSEYRKTLGRLGITGAQADAAELGFKKQVDAHARSYQLETARKNDEEVAVLATSLATSPPPGMENLTADEYATAAMSRLEAEMQARNIPEDRRRTERAYLGRMLESNAQNREINRLNSMASGVRVANDRDFEQQFTDWINNGTQAPDFVAGRERVNQLLMQQGVDLTSEPANKVRNLEMQRALAQIQNYRKSVDLSPTPDNPGENQRRAGIRQRLLYSEMTLGSVYGNRVLASEIANRVSGLISTANVETTENNVAAYEDLLYAVSMAQANNVPLESVMPSGDAGKAMEEEIRYSLEQMRIGIPVTQIARDVAQKRYFGTSLRIDQKNIFNPLSYTDLQGRGEDAQQLSRTHDDLGRNYGITNSDAMTPFAAYLRRGYLEALTQTKDHRQALELARNKMEANFIYVRGSVIPKVGEMARAANAPTFIESWLDRKFPNQNATLVVVGEEANGEPILSPRLPNGESVPGDVQGLYRMSDIKLEGPEMVEYRRRIGAEPWTPPANWRGPSY